MIAAALLLLIVINFLAIITLFRMAIAIEKFATQLEKIQWPENRTNKT